MKEIKKRDEGKTKKKTKAKAKTRRKEGGGRVWGGEALRGPF